MAIAPACAPAPRAEPDVFDPAEIAKRVAARARLVRSRGHRQLRDIGEAARVLVELIEEFVAEHDSPRSWGAGCGCHFCRYLAGHDCLEPRDFLDELKALRRNVTSGVGQTVEQVPGT